MTTAAKKIKTTAAVFELPQKLGILQYVEYEPPPREWCVNECLYEGVLMAEGCKKGVCVRYRVWVWSKDRRRWEAKERWRRRRDEETGGCIKQQVADALWELAERGVDVGVWYKRVEEKVGMFRYETYVYCGPVVNGVELDQPQCRTAEECARQILEEYKNEVKRRSEPPPPPPPDPVEELLREWPELEAFGVDWVRKWLDLKHRLVEIAKVLRRYPWMVDVVRRNPMNVLNPYTVNAFVAKDSSETCLQLGASKTFCARDGEVREVKLELEFKRYEEYEGRMRGVYRPKGLLAFAAGAKEYVEVL
jgi:hypothetical protein